MGWDNSFDDNENDYGDPFACQDSQDESRRGTYGALSDGYLLDDTGKKSSNCIADAEFFEKVYEVRTKVTVANPIFKAAADGFHNNEFSAPKLVFTTLPTIPVTISTNPDIIVYNDILGCYVGKDYHIEMDMDKIESEASSLSVKSTDLAIIVFFHELMHHLMRVQNNRSDKGRHLYWTFREEAMANALMLRFLCEAGEDRLRHIAMDFISKQPADLGYTYSLFMPYNDRDDIEGWRNLKSDGNMLDKDMDSYVDHARQILRDNGFILEYDSVKP